MAVVTEEIDGMAELPELPEHVKGWIGKSLIEDEGEFDIEQGYIATSCASVQNGNPLFWDKEVAREITGGAIAPPSMMSVWIRPHFWAPGHTEQRWPLELHFRLKKELDLPEAIVASNEIIFGEPVRLGDKLRCKQTLRSISEPKTIKLGTGRFWTLDVDYFNQRDEWVGTESYSFFGYRRD
jgi:acyl dehydratase